MARSNGPLHLHIENSSRLGEIFEISKTRLDDALGRHPQATRDVEITIGRDGDGFREAMASAEVLFGWDFERENLVKYAPRLRWIQIQGAGVNHLLPFDWLPPGIILTNSRGAHGRRGSEYLIMAILALNNGLPAMVTNQREGRWQQIHTSAIGGKTLLIFGVGHVGGDTAKVAKSFGLHILGVRRTGAAHKYVDEMYRPTDLKALLPRADFILITAPHTRHTECIIGPQEFDLMKKGAGIVNYSRSRLVDYEALRKTLEAGHISAVVDVFDEEPQPSSSPFWQLPNLIITPHSSSNDPLHHAHRSLDLLFENLARYLANEKLENIIDPAEQY